MPSSTSSSSARTPQLRWKTELLLPALLAAIVGLGLEIALARRGFEPTAVDSVELWSQERDRATALGPSAIVLIGSSRIQLGLDVPLLASTTGRSVAQLAIDGSSFVPVLRGLAEDEQFSGTVVVDYLDDVVDDLDRKDTAFDYESAFEQTERVDVGMAARAEVWLTRHLKLRLRAYADGATPWDSFWTRALAEDATPQYLVTYPDRSRSADFALVQMPQFYWMRVVRNLGYAGVRAPANFGALGFEDALAVAAGAVPMASTEGVQRNSRIVRGWVQRVQQRGGRVVFVVMPTSRLVTAIERTRYPRAHFWDVFTATVGAEAVHFEDYQTLHAFQCPDGSHLDRRDKAAFTAALSKIVFPP